MNHSSLALIHIQYSPQKLHFLINTIEYKILPKDNMNNLPPFHRDLLICYVFYRKKCDRNVNLKQISWNKEKTSIKFFQSSTTKKPNLKPLIQFPTVQLLGQ